MKIKNYVILLMASIALFNSCGETKKIETFENAQSYEILRTEPFESNSKAQINVYAYLTEDYKSKELLEITAKKIKQETIDSGNFKKHKKASAYTLFLYPGKRMAENQGTWLARYSMGPKDTKYEFDFNESAIQAQDKTTTKPKTENEIAFEALDKRLKTENTTACDIYFQITEYETNNIKKADRKYPNFGTKHSDYVSQLDKIEKDNLTKKYNITKSEFTVLIWQGLKMCK